MSAAEIERQALADIVAERARQEAKFPGQRLPATAVQRLREVAPRLWRRLEGGGNARRRRFYAAAACSKAGIPSEGAARAACETEPDYTHVIVEELAEAVEKMAIGDAEGAYTELIQLSATALRAAVGIKTGDTIL
jgi:hypothetical protein